MNFWKWLFKNSPDKASDPNPSPLPVDAFDSDITGGVNHPIEMFVEQDAIWGMGFNFGCQDSVSRGAKGLERYHKRFSILCGCGHIVSQLHAENEDVKSSQRSLGGKCFYCEKDFEKMVNKGRISAVEAERQSLVCSECARMVSRVLCCPKHYAAATDENGGTVYLGPDEQEKQKRDDTVKKILTPFATLFLEPDRPQLPKPEDAHE